MTEQQAPPAVPASSESRPASGSVARAAAYTALTNLVLPLTSLATAPILARELGVTGRGEMAAVVAPIFILTVIAHFGLPEATAYALAKLRQDPRRVLRSAGGLTLVYGLFAAVFVWWAAPVLLRNVPDLVPLLRGVAWLLPLTMWAILMRALLLGMREYAAPAVERVLTPVLRLVAFVSLMLAGSLTVTTAVLAHVFCAVAGGLFLLAVLLRRRASPVLVVEPASAVELVETPVVEPAHTRLTRQIALYGLRGWGGTLGTLITWRLDQMVLVMLVSATQLGYYVVAVALAEISMMAVNALRAIIFSEAAHRGGSELVAQSARIILMMTTLVAIGGSLVAGPFIYILFGSDFGPSVDLARVLLLASIPFCVDQILTAGVYAEGRPGLRSISQLIGAAVAIGLLVLLAPTMGAMGAAVASLAAYSLTCAITVLQYRHLTGTSARQMLVPQRSDVEWVQARVARVAAKVRR